MNKVWIFWVTAACFLSLIRGPPFRHQASAVPRRYTEGNGQGDAAQRVTCRLDELEDAPGGLVDAHHRALVGSSVAAGSR